MILVLTVLVSQTQTVYIRNVANPLEDDNRDLRADLRWTEATHQASYH